MADDLSKKILIDIEVGTDGQEQISQYKAAFDSLRNTIGGLTDPLGNMSNNISSLPNFISASSTAWRLLMPRVFICACTQRYISR